MTNVAPNLDLLIDPTLSVVESDSPVSLIEEPNGLKVISDFAYHSMLVEVHHTPKPGLVDVESNGAHTDMDVPLFELSAQAIRPYIEHFAATGFFYRDLPAHALLSKLRPVGIEAEKAMLKATSGVNTHKGMIFGLGLITGAAGWLLGKSLPVDALHISKVIKATCQLLVLDELKKNRSQADCESNGQRLFREYGLTGARGEAASGYSTILDYALPEFESLILDGASSEDALRQTLLVIMAKNQDSNVVNRSGVSGLSYVQSCARNLLNQGGVENPKLKEVLRTLDHSFIQKNISPGGSADLLAMTWLLAQIEQLDLLPNHKDALWVAKTLNTANQCDCKCSELSLGSCVCSNQSIYHQELSS
ncbi:triphosphoribosyl-dephospho-CoA synthase CitG [Vibrio salinus]|uniref:triphosphoribosyl-dephospho-CoA synthase CitG n=1 Tax=Vibrio salinus TaxID=2899784 RepID=UPI001E63571B|nr:triphosphoribosyl-dephospho-CoA synthase CitG [Vibrio salinus]MCE0492799.1 triphosphoribosyl-dephospho-CoA synthase CitG [Vibrio salinus]